MLDEDLRNATTVKAFEKAMKLVMNEWMIEWQLEFNNISLLDVACIFICK